MSRIPDLSSLVSSAFARGGDWTKSAFFLSFAMIFCDMRLTLLYTVKPRLQPVKRLLTDREARNGF